MYEGKLNWLMILHCVYIPHPIFWSIMIRETGKGTFIYMQAYNNNNISWTDSIFIYMPIRPYYKLNNIFKSSFDFDSIFVLKSVLQILFFMQFSGTFASKRRERWNPISSYYIELGNIRSKSLFLQLKLKSKPQKSIFFLKAPI